MANKINTRQVNESLGISQTPIDVIHGGRYCARHGRIVEEKHLEEN